jgi:hypothetical protein
MAEPCKGKTNLVIYALIPCNYLTRVRQQGKIRMDQRIEYGGASASHVQQAIPEIGR